MQKSMEIFNEGKAAFAVYDDLGFRPFAANNRIRDNLAARETRCEIQNNRLMSRVLSEGTRKQKKNNARSERHSK